MEKAYDFALSKIVISLQNGGKCLDCGANHGEKFERINSKMKFSKEKYFGIEWNKNCVQQARANGLNVIQGGGI